MIFEQLEQKNDYLKVLKLIEDIIDMLVRLLKPYQLKYVEEKNTVSSQIMQAD